MTSTAGRSLRAMHSGNSVRRHVVRTCSLTGVSAQTTEREKTDPQAVLLRVLADRLPAMLAYWDADLRCQFANRAYEKWFGVKPETVLGQRMDELLGPLFALNLPYIQGALRGEEQEFEREIPDPAGGPIRHSQAHYIPDIRDGRVHGFCVLVVDITRRKRAEAALQRAERQLQAVERLSAMSTLAAGIGHEINNPLTIVLGNLELVLAELSSPENASPADRAQHDLQRQQLSEVQRAAGHIAEIVQSMKLLARGDASQRESVDVDTIVKRSVQLVSNALRYRAHVKLDLRAEGRVDANASQLAQVLVNLLMNAVQSLRVGAPLGEITVSTHRAEDQLVIEVSDNGCGIPEELQTRIFEPFFTTKGVGSVGLGLSISRSIVSAYGGTLVAQSTVGVGSVFRVSLPAEKTSHASAPTTGRQQGMHGGAQPRAKPARPQVLVVDDEPGLRTLAVYMLRGAYEVTCAASVDDALSILADAHATFAVILCDLMMPERSGAEFYTEVAERWPELASRFVFMTGGAFTGEGRAFLRTVDAPVLDKPFSASALRTLVAARIAALSSELTSRSA